MATAFEIYSRQKTFGFDYEDDRASLVGSRKKIEFQTDLELISLSKFEISMEIVISQLMSKVSLELSEIGASLDFIPAQGQDLTNTATWGLIYAQVLVNELDIASLRKKFEPTEYFIPKSGALPW